MENSISRLEHRVVISVLMISGLCCVSQLPCCGAWPHVSAEHKELGTHLCWILCLWSHGQDIQIHSCAAQILLASNTSKLIQATKYTNHCFQTQLYPSLCFSPMLMHAAEAVILAV